MKALRCFLAILGLSIALAVPTWADTSIGFEAPTYTSGIKLAGQDGWTTSSDANWYVVDWGVIDGVYSAHVDADSFAYRSLAGQSLNNDSTVTCTVKMDDVAGANSNIYLNDTSGNCYAVFRMAEGLFRMLNSTGTGWVQANATEPVWYPNEVIAVTIKLNFTSSKWMAVVDNITYPAAGFTTPWTPFTVESGATAVTPGTAAGQVSIRGKAAWFDSLGVTDGTAPIPMSFKFEPPMYTASRLAGQDGWTTSSDPNWYVVDWGVIDGVYSAHVDAQNSAFHSTAGYTFKDGNTISDTIKTDSTFADSNAGFWLLNAAGNTFAAVWINSNNYIYTLNGTGTGWDNSGHQYTKGDVLVATYTLDFTSSKWSVKVDNLTTPASSFRVGGKAFSAPTTTTTVGNIQISGKSAWHDNVLVREPSPLDINFESPTYSQTWLDGQDGWTVDRANVWMNTDWLPIGGLYSAHVDWQSYAKRSMSTQVFQDGTTLTATVKAGESGTNPARAIVSLLDTSGNNYTGFHASDTGWLHYLNQGSTAWVNTGQIYNPLDLLKVSMTLNFTLNMWRMSVTNLTEASDTYRTGWLPFCTSITPATAAGSLSIGGQFAWFDDIKLTQETITMPSPVTLREAKQSSANTDVNCTAFVSAKYGSWFNIEDAARTMGIVVAGPDTGLSLGQEVKIIGTTRLNDTLGELGIYDPLITPLGGSHIIDPLGMTNKALGGGAFGIQGGVLGGSGLNNIGLFVKTTGRVSGGSGNTFILDDGSGVSLQAWYDGTLPADGSYIAATGTVSTVKDVDGNLLPRILLTGFTTIP